MLGPVTTFALELGDASIKSGLGQSLRVEIPYRLAANETLTPICVGLVPPPNAASALPTYTRASRVSISSSHIEIVGEARVLEPLIGLNVEVRCATTPHLVRSYQLFVDPPARLPTTIYSATERAAPTPVAVAEANTSVAPTAAAASARPASTESAASLGSSPSPRARGQSGGTLSQGQTYRVVRGDTLSGIAARVADRTSIRDAANAIFAANPQAFRRGDRNLLEEGRSITIPVMTSPPVELAAVALPVPPPEVRDAEQTSTMPAAAVELPPAFTSVEPEPRSTDLSTPVARPTLEPLVEIVAVAEPIADALPATTASEAAGIAGPAATGRASTWLTIVLAFGAGILVSIPLRLLRRRKAQAALEVETKVHGSHPQRLADPVAGISVVEGQIGRSPAQALAGSTAASSAKAAPAALAAEGPRTLDDLATTIGPVDAVDLDIGAPLMSDERAADARSAAVGLETSEETAATARMPSIDNVTALEQSRTSKTDLSHRTVDDEQMTMTIVELDMLRQDYEAEHTMTQEANRALRDALADLKATQAARAANAEAATIEMPQQSDGDATESLQTAKLRAAR